ncbi:hypothetical protein [Helicobacter sp. MIT 14-3879]|uniref:hypothetical protein n=1 Tax=Helicobacter sp. MIT 14-3879 TaxID=2040649 RepID=UPI000E1E5A56|nr:hypothetical protein [Helicobacter sp. MIT 14-3879]RDU63928.1 hypothetical protein CQA44_04620 [Helicobacter sp. MIT 14-3879]
MSETYIIYAANGVGVEVNKETNEIYFSKGTKEAGKYNKKHSDIYFKTHKARETSPYINYKPIYLDPTLKTGQSSNYLEFKAWQDLYLKEPVKGSIAPWTKAEKAYYESLKTKRERYKYLVIRSGLRSSVIDIPYDAYAGVDENGKLINEDYAYLYEEVEANRGLAHLGDGYLFMGEWELAAGILGDINGFKSALQLSSTGFKARASAVRFLLLQLGYKEVLFGKNPIESYLAEAHESFRGLSVGMHVNALRALQIKEFSKNPPYDKYRMLPFLDELIGVDWVIDLNVMYGYSVDENGFTLDKIKEEIDRGKLLDPRDPKATEQTRIEFKERMKKVTFWRYDVDLSNERTQQSVDLYINTMLLEAKVMSITPPQGYPNAPTYYIPEYLEELYKEHKLDKKLKPTIPAMYRENFPEWLRKEIEDYKK